LPYAVVDGDMARAVVDAVERELLTSTGLRTLAPVDPQYRGRCDGTVAQRDGAYHQGTVWPWLTGAFVDAWLRVHGNDAKRRAEARDRFVAPLEAHVGISGLGHLFEIADGDPPHTPRGCPFQAWSLGELLRAKAATA
jgi:glycogen debranching enzyme